MKVLKKSKAFLGKLNLIKQNCKKIYFSLVVILAIFCF